MSVRLGMLVLLGLGRGGLGKVPASQAVLRGVDVQVVLLAVHESRKGGKEIVGIGGARRGLGVVLDREARGVEQLDALGGEMGKNIDKTFIQSKMLNESKGPAVHSLRAQADKQEYTRSMRRVLENTDHLTIRQAEVAEILTEEIPGECGTFKKEHEGQQESS